MDTEVRKVKNLEELQKVVQLRQDVFCEEQKFSSHLIHDDKDGGSEILVLEEGGEILGTSRIRYINQSAKFELMLVSKEARGRGLGDVLLGQMIENAKSRNYSSCKLNGQIRLSSYYEKHGFKKSGCVFFIEGVGHLSFVRELI